MAPTKVVANFWRHRALTPDERPEIAKAVVLRDIGGLDHAETVTALGLPLGPVEPRIARGRSALKTMLTR